MKAFKDILIHDIIIKEFADIYAQTIAYGMFAARLHDPTLENFARQEAAELIPKSNPFLRKLFGYIAGPDIMNALSGSLMHSQIFSELLMLLIFLKTLEVLHSRPIQSFIFMKHFLPSMIPNSVKHAAFGTRRNLLLILLCALSMIFLKQNLICQMDLPTDLKQKLK